jgi:MerR family transcriptional regulator, light-induced transcriptional regulator
MANYSIKDLERLTGIKAHTIRIWEKRYNLIEPERTATNIRAYCDAELKKLLNISILNKNGYKISKIANLTPDEIANNINKLSESSSDSLSQIENLAIAMIDIDETKFEKILSRSIIQLGFEDTVNRILRPFFVKIGLMWQTGSINPAQEHFVSNLVRQKMLVAIDSQITGESPNSKNFTLFLPEGEMHELGLLFANYQIRKRGHNVVYLGQSVPLADLMEIERIKPSDYFLTSFITSLTDYNLMEYLYVLLDKYPEKKIFVTGQQAELMSENFPANVKFLDSPDALTSELNIISSL